MVEVWCQWGLLPCSHSSYYPYGCEYAEELSYTGSNQRSFQISINFLLAFSSFSESPVGSHTKYFLCIGLLWPNFYCVESAYFRCFSEVKGVLNRLGDSICLRGQSLVCRGTGKAGRQRPWYAETEGVPCCCLCLILWVRCVVLSHRPMIPLQQQVFTSLRQYLPATKGLCQSFLTPTLGLITTG